MIFYLFIDKNANWILLKKNPKKSQNETHERYQNLSEEKENKNCQYARKRYQNLTEEGFITRILL